MRLGLLIYGSLESRSGGYLYDRQLVQELERAGDEVEVTGVDGIILDIAPPTTD